MKKIDRYYKIKSILDEIYPDAGCSLKYEKPHELLVATILAAQCTDKRVNIITKTLFKKYKSPSDFANADYDELCEDIKTAGLFRSKAKNIIACFKKIEKDFGGAVPQTLKELITLPGVGRKTANVVASIIYNEPVIAVDTHVFRVARRLGLSRGSTPRAVELDLERHIPEDIRPIAHHWLILHGRYICKAQKPDCTHCPISSFCTEFSRKQSLKSVL